MSDLVGNPEDRFSHNEARIMTGFSIINLNLYLISLAQHTYNEIIYIRTIGK